MVAPLNPSEKLTILQSTGGSAFLHPGTEMQFSGSRAQVQSYFPLPRSNQLPIRISPPALPASLLGSPAIVGPGCDHKEAKVETADGDQN